MKKNIALICNPAAEAYRVLRITDTLINILKQKQLSFTVFTKVWPIDWNEFSDAWIIGGDGTLNYFINKYPDIELPLSIFPGGTGNDFHWMLYGNMNIENQVDQILNGEKKMVDAGICNDLLFLNGLGIGFDGAIVNDLSGKRKLAGKTSYLISILKNIITYKEKLYHMFFDGNIIETKCFMISVANGRRYGGGFLVAPEASFSDSLLDVIIINKIAPLKRIRYLPVIEKGKHIHLPFIKYKQTAEILIQTNEAVHAHIDGEYLQSDMFKVVCIPKKFAFLVPMLAGQKTLQGSSLL